MNPEEENINIEQPVDEQPTEETPVEQPIDEQPTEETPVEQPVDEQPTEETPVEQPIDEQPTEETPVEQPVDEQPTEETPTEQPVDEQPTEETPTEQPVDEQPTEETPDNNSAEISIADAAIVEGNNGNTSLEFTVSLSQPINQVATTNYSTFDGSALAGEDYVATSGSLTFQPGETSQTIRVDIIGDTVDEEDETFIVGLSNAEGVAIANLEATGTITDDDGADVTNPPSDTPTVSITADPTSIPEGNEGDTNTLDYTIGLDRVLERDVRVNLVFNRTGNGQNVSFNDTVTIPAGQQSFTYNAGDISGDNVEEEDENTTITLENASFADGGGGDIAISDSQPSATITVVDDDGGSETNPGTNPGDDTTDGDGNTDGGDTPNGGNGNDIVYRFFNPSAGVHFYTDDEIERDFVQNELDNYEFEGPSYRTVDPLTGGAEDVYRFFNPSTGVHLYTTSEVERDNIIENLDEFTFEGAAYSAYETEVEGSIPIYRFFEPNIGVHFYTPNETERDFVEEELDNYNSEGIAFYALPLEDM